MRGEHVDQRARRAPRGASRAASSAQSGGVRRITPSTNVHHVEGRAVDGGVGAERDGWGTGTSVPAQRRDARGARGAMSCAVGQHVAERRAAQHEPPRRRRSTTYVRFERPPATSVAAGGPASRPGCWRSKPAPSTATRSRPGSASDMCAMMAPMPRTRVLTPLRWSDMDAYGHVNNVQFLRLLEDARVIGFEDSFGQRPLRFRAVPGSSWPATEIEYLAPLPLPIGCRRSWSRCGPPRSAEAELRTTWPTRCRDGRAASDGGDGDTIYARAETTLVLYDRVRRPAAPHDAVRARAARGLARRAGPVAAQEVAVVMPDGRLEAMPRSSCRTPRRSATSRPSSAGRRRVDPDGAAPSRGAPGRARGVRLACARRERARRPRPARAPPSPSRPRLDVTVPLAALLDRLRARAGRSASAARTRCPCRPCQRERRPGPGVAPAAARAGTPTACSTPPALRPAADARASARSPTACHRVPGPQAVAQLRARVWGRPLTAEPPDVPAGDRLRRRRARFPRTTPEPVALYRRHALGAGDDATRPRARPASGSAVTA